MVSRGRKRYLNQQHQRWQQQQQYACINSNCQPAVYINYINNHHNNNNNNIPSLSPSTSYFSNNQQQYYDWTMSVCSTNYGDNDSNSGWEDVDHNQKYDNNTHHLQHQQVRQPQGQSQSSQQDIYYQQQPSSSPYGVIKNIKSGKDDNDGGWVD
ncbi:hypothetical protein FRACYDRAFT_271977 [Fragilariopsis cylindrus CCMP1102]|uniref:Uncharacterized protein n=1 Tax=Fragilariopsis cylindrus CCMP1102 TaxID=635003 RepID=A0A1E7ENC7_9STRA|nr:hypothetical protein FRACYDRAFT_271977 [Fragilariopsis cylindrus CCMP1102]|eukprot:OEU07307.1 hypothetical protein FRACYDRAFT_271977 [Fragilariopsis cylindrus CCMP1102]